jgi:sigma-B regulation protein RsbU (phosphoserine phosphatase)
MMRFQDQQISIKLIILTVPLIAVATLVMSVLIYERDSDKVHDKLVHRAKSLVHQINADRQYYASEIVPRIKELGGTLGADYRAVHGRFPLPATFVREVSEKTEELGNGFTANLISPWPINKDKGIKDEFQRDAFANLAANPTGQFIRNDVLDGRPVLRYMTADIAGSQSCVDCHNAHGQSPKHDFKLNDVMGGLEIVIPMEQYIREGAQDLTLTAAAGVGLCMVVLGIIAIGTNRTVTAPLAALSRRMEQFVGREGMHPIKAPALPISDEVAHLSDAFEQMQAVITAQQGDLRDANLHLENRVVERTEQLKRTTAEKERISSELRVASEIQKSILPRTFPPFPHREDFVIYAEAIPAKEMGGDFYDFFLIDEDRLAFVIADVSGKGVPAAIFMAITRTLVKATALKGVSPAECLQQVNSILCPENDSAMFVTIFYAILNTRTHEVLYSNGGHNIPYILSREGGVELLQNTPGMALGIDDTFMYQTKCFTVCSGDALFLYTDGVTEAMNHKDEMFSDQRLKSFLEQRYGATPEDIIRGAISEVKAFVGDVPQSDDITILALRYS